MGKEYIREDIIQKFNEGARLLGTKYLEESIAIFSELIEICEQNISNPDAKTTLQNALNKCGEAKCSFGLEKSRRELIEKGIQDFERSINEASEDAPSWLERHLVLCDIGKMN